MTGLVEEPMPTADQFIVGLRGRRMEFTGKIAVVTGAGRGIGAAICKAMAQEGARVVVSDRDAASARAVAAELDTHAIPCDVSTEAGVQTLIAEVTETLGPIDVFVSNAGLAKGEPGHVASASDADWDLNWRVHVMAHVWAARALLPQMLDSGAGYFINVASAAGLLNQIGDAAYSATKHAALSFAESLAIMHGKDGIGVSVLCPQYVATPLIGLSGNDAADIPNLLSANEVADAVITGVKADKFLILSHPQVAQYTALRATDHDRWITGMQILKSKVVDEFGEIDPKQMYKLV